MSEVIVVTGASAGLGRAIVERFARDGSAIALIARVRDRLENARASVEALGGRALVLGARGPFDDRAKTASTELWLAKRKPWVALAGAVITDAVVGVFGARDR